MSDEAGSFTRSVAIVGGGLAGLISSILLVRRGWSVTLFEKKQHPFHRVCGEYISNETVPFLESEGLFPKELHPETITRLQLTSVNGKSAEMELDLGGFGVSRYAFDHFLYRKAIEAGVDVRCNTEITSIEQQPDSFVLKTSDSVHDARVVIGAHGKRSKLDYDMKRSFVDRRSPYVGVKYHIKTNHARGLISLHNFYDGYCGISNIENGESNLCYLTHRNNLKQHGNIRKMEEEILFRNPFLKSIFEKAQFVFEKPEVINEITFETKAPVENGVLMSGDAAGMITPLCGNGMAMAIHSAKIVSEWTHKFMLKQIDRRELESGYAKRWNVLFAKRLWAGRQVQRLFGSEKASDFAVNLARNVKPVANFLVRQTHGNPF